MNNLEPRRWDSIISILRWDILVSCKPLQYSYTFWQAIPVHIRVIRDQGDEQAHYSCQHTEVTFIKKLSHPVSPDKYKSKNKCTILQPCVSLSLQSSTSINIKPWILDKNDEVLPKLSPDFILPLSQGWIYIKPRRCLATSIISKIFNHVY